MSRTLLGEATQDPEAFVLITARHEQRTRGRIAALLPFDHAAVDDLVQATCMVAWRKVASCLIGVPEPAALAVAWACYRP